MDNSLQPSLTECILTWHSFWNISRLISENTSHIYSCAAINTYSQVTDIPTCPVKQHVEWIFHIYPIKLAVKGLNMTNLLRLNPLSNTELLLRPFFCLYLWYSIHRMPSNFEYIFFFQETQIKKMQTASLLLFRNNHCSRLVLWLKFPLLSSFFFLSTFPIHLSIFTLNKMVIF